MSQPVPVAHYRTLAGDPVPWYEPGNCVICGFSHRYQWPSGSDASKHDGSYVACVNSLMYALRERWAVTG